LILIHIPAIVLLYHRIITMRHVLDEENNKIEMLYTRLNKKGNVMDGIKTNGIERMAMRTTVAGSKA
jgi:hypothetical protein